MSVIIVNYKTCELTDACVRSLKCSAGAHKIEVIVVDNCSQDGSAEVLGARHPDIKVIAAPENGGFAYGNALGFQEAHAQRVLLLNPDTQVFADTIRSAMQALDQDCSTGVVGAHVLLPDGSQQNSTIRFPRLRALFFNVLFPADVLSRTSWFGDQRYASLDQTKAHCVDAVSGCFMLVRRQVIDEVGGLDPRFFMYAEEVEWCYRIRAAGWNIVYRPEVRVMHHGGASTNHMTVWKAREMMRGQLLYFALTGGRWKARGAAALMIARDLARLPIALFGALPGLGRRDRLHAIGARLALGLASLGDPPRGQPLPAGLDECRLRAPRSSQR